MVDKRIQNDIAKTSKTNPKAFWKYVKSKTKCKEPICDLKYVDQHRNALLASTDVCKADALCDCLFKVFNKDTDSNFIRLGSKNSQYLSELPLFDCDDIKIRLQKLNTTKSPGPDGIHPRILVEAANQIAYPLKLLFECSFNTSQLPGEWKYFLLPARRALFSELTGCKTFAKKFCQIRWTANASVADAALKLYDNVCKFVKEEKKLLKGLSSVAVIKESSADPLFKAKLVCFASVAKATEGFLTKF